MEDNFWVEESREQISVCTKRKRRAGKKRIEFIGWASRALIEFLEAIGKDTTVKHTQREVEAFITTYVNDKRLASVKKKKKILCDQTLHALFGKKSMPRTKIYDLLEEHFAENHDNSDDDLESSDEEHCGENSAFKRISAGQMTKAPKAPKSCFAAVVGENIKLLYLKRTLIETLLEVPESFEFKMVGSFVRMKSNPNDIYQKNRFQLQQVTAVEKFPGAGDAVSEIRLRVSNFFKEVTISMLSDDNFSEEEIKDLHDRVKAGSLKKLTVMELQVKAEILHADITNHWIGRELSVLQGKIDRASEKGWRRELFDYIDRRKMLNTQSEREKLLRTIPEVVAEESEPELEATVTSEKAEGSPKSILKRTSDVSTTDASESRAIVVPAIVTVPGAIELEASSGADDGI